MNETAVKLENIRLNIGGNLILSELNLNVEKNCIHTIIGTTGTGKSVLLKICAGMLTKYDGSRSINNARLSFVFQENAFLDWLTIRKNIELSSRQTIDSNPWLKRFNLDGYLDFVPKSLSGGTKQKFNLLRAFLNKPDIILLDEPFSHLDQIQKEDLYNFTLQLWNEYRPTILLVTHDIDEAIYLSHKISFLSKVEKKLTKTLAIREISEAHSPDLASEKKSPYYTAMFDEIHSLYRRDKT